jgi:hypothetical protein
MTDTKQGPPADGERVGRGGERRQPAPELTEGLDWIGVDHALTLSELHGKVVLLDFWTYG